MQTVTLINPATWNVYNYLIITIDTTLHKVQLQSQIALKFLLVIRKRKT